MADLGYFRVSDEQFSWKSIAIAAGVTLNFYFAIFPGRFSFSAMSEGSQSPRSNSSSPPETPSPATPPNFHQNLNDPSATWIVQKYGGTSIGKFAARISEDIVPYVL